jgi:hypothetical protein
MNIKNAGSSLLLLLLTLTFINAQVTENLSIKASPSMGYRYFLINPAWLIPRCVLPVSRHVISIVGASPKRPFSRQIKT